MDVEKEILEVYDRLEKEVNSAIMQAQNIAILTTTIRLLTDRVAKLEKTQAQDNGCVSKEKDNG